MTLVTDCNNGTPGRSIQYCDRVYCHKQRQGFVKNFLCGSNATNGGGRMSYCENSSKIIGKIDFYCLQLLNTFGLK